MQKNPKPEFLQIPSQTKSVNKINMIEVKNEGMIHDVCYDFFGTKIALGSSDGHIEIQEINVNSFKSEQQKDILSYKIPDLCETPKFITLQGIKFLLFSKSTCSQHKGPVWQLSWSNPKYGNILASCSFDKTICLFKEQKFGKYSLLLQLSEHKESVQSIQWSYRKLILAAGVADGSVHIQGEIEYIYQIYEQFKHQFYSLQKAIESYCITERRMDKLKINRIGNTNLQHKSCVNQVSWVRDKELDFATCSTDKTISVWKVTTPIDGEYKLFQIQLIECDSWVRSIDWAAEQFDQNQILAAGMESSQVEIFYLKWDQNNDKQVKISKAISLQTKGPCWKVQWSPLGNQLAISTLDDKNDPFVQVYRQSQNGEFAEI